MLFSPLQNPSITTGLKTVATAASLISQRALAAPSLIIKTPRINVSWLTWRPEIKHPVDTTACYLIVCRPVTSEPPFLRHICCRWWSDYDVCLLVDSCFGFPLDASPHFSESPLGKWKMNMNQGSEHYSVPTFLSTTRSVNTLQRACAQKLLVCACKTLQAKLKR